MRMKHYKLAFKGIESYKPVPLLIELCHQNHQNQRRDQAACQRDWRKLKYSSIRMKCYYSNKSLLVYRYCYCLLNSSLIELCEQNEDRDRQPASCHNLRKFRVISMMMNHYQLVFKAIESYKPVPLPLICASKHRERDQLPASFHLSFSRSSHNLLCLLHIYWLMFFTRWLV